MELILHELEILVLVLKDAGWTAPDLQLRRRQRITRELTGLGLAYAEPQGNFVFFNTGKPLERFTELMHARNILVGRPFPPYDTWCRITIGTEPEVTAFLQAFHAIPA